jgi:hypothetical protein
MDSKENYLVFSPFLYNLLSSFEVYTIFLESNQFRKRNNWHTVPGWPSAHGLQYWLDPTAWVAWPTHTDGAACVRPRGGHRTPSVSGGAATRPMKGVQRRLL